MSSFHHAKLPDFSTVLAGHTPQNEVGFRSEKLQIFYNHTDTPWRDDKLHAHRESDECFIVLKGQLTVNVEGELHAISAGEFCCFPVGIYHAVVAVQTPAETLMIRALSVDDKVYQLDG